MKGSHLIWFFLSSRHYLSRPEGKDNIAKHDGFLLIFRFKNDFPQADNGSGESKPLIPLNFLVRLVFQLCLTFFILFQTLEANTKNYFFYCLQFFFSGNFIINESSTHVTKERTNCWAKIDISVCPNFYKLRDKCSNVFEILFSIRLIVRELSCRL